MAGRAYPGLRQIPSQGYVAGEVRFASTDRTRTEAEKAAKWTSGSKVRIIPWPVEHIPDYDKYRARAMLLEKYDLPRQTRVAIFCGRLDPIKRPPETIRHFKATAGRDWADRKRVV